VDALLAMNGTPWAGYQADSAGAEATKVTNLWAENLTSATKEANAKRDEAVRKAKSGEDAAIKAAESSPKEQVAKAKAEYDSTLLGSAADVFFADFGAYETQWATLYAALPATDITSPTTALTPDTLVHYTAPAADAASVLLGRGGDRFIAAAIAISTFGFLDLAILAPTRVYYAMAADGLFLPALARLHPRYRTPSLAIGLQSGWSIVLALTGTFAQLLDYVVFADWIFFGLSVGSLFIFRRRVPPATRENTFLTPGYPVLPALFVVVAVAVVLSVVWSSPWQAARGALLLAVGVPVFYYHRRRHRMSAGDRKQAFGNGL